MEAHTLPVNLRIVTVVQMPGLTPHTTGKAWTVHFGMDRFEKILGCDPESNRTTRQCVVVELVVEVVIETVVVEVKEVVLDELDME